MGGLLILIVAVLILSPIGLFAWNLSLSRRVNELEEQVSGLAHRGKSAASKKTVVEKVEEPAFERQPISARQEAEHAPLAERIESDKKTTSKTPEQAPRSSQTPLEFLLGGKFFAILGGVCMVLATGYFAKWSFESGLIGPRGRIALGAVFSLILMIVGEFMKNKYPRFFPLLTASGLGGLITLTYLCRVLYNREIPITSTQGFAILATLVATGLLLTLRYNSRILGNFVAASGLIAPLLVHGEPKPISLLAYLSIFSVAGFLISTRKNWPEILGILFVGVTGFEIGIHTQGLLKPSPFIFLGFLFFLHLLFGSGGIVRLVREKKTQSLDEPEASNVFEILLFVVSIFIANCLAALVFKEQSQWLLGQGQNDSRLLLVWDHFGFLVILEGFLFHLLSRFLANRELLIFQRIAMAAALLSVPLATVWELHSGNPLVLTLLLAAESALFLYAGQTSKNPLFTVFGQLGMLCATYWMFQIDERKTFAEYTVASAALFTGLWYGLWKNHFPPWPEAGKGLWVVLGTVILHRWSFYSLSPLLTPHLDPLLLQPIAYLLPLGWAVVLGGLGRRLVSDALLFAGGVYLVILNALLLSNDLTYSNLLLVALTLVANFALLGFYRLSKTPSVASFKNLMAYGTLLLCSIDIVYYGDTLAEPWKTVFLIGWAAAMLGVGLAKNWPPFRHAGLVGLLLMILKIFSDVFQSGNMLLKFAASFALAIVLITVAFFYQKKLKK